jgi:lipopolysaccharide transport system permease protein
MPKPPPIVVIGPPAGWGQLDLRSLWDYRELLYLLAWRDVTVRYKQTLLGVTWALLQPLLMMAVFSLFFGRLGRLPADGQPYPLFVLTGLLPWQLFAHALGEATNSLLINERLLTKVYFPRLILPLSATLAALADFVAGFPLLVAFALFYDVSPGWRLLFVPGFVILTMLAALAAGLWLSALNVSYRDVRYTLTFIVQLWLFITPVVYPAALVPISWRGVYALNPMVGITEGFRWALLGTTGFDLRLLPSSLTTLGLVLLGGLVYFRRMERSFGDVV